MEFLIPLWAHQKEAIMRAAQVNEFALFFEVGAGKTSTCINALRYKYLKHAKVLRTLILCPPIVIENWRREFVMHSKVADKVVCLVGTGKKRAELILRHMDKNVIFVTNFESLLMADVFNLLVEYAPECFVVDEVHKCKDLKSKRTKATIKLADQAKYKFILTGTPILNSPMDIFAQFRILDKGETFGANFFAFRARYFFDKNSLMPRERYFPNWQIRPGALEEINKLISAKSMHVKKASCLDLPPLVKEQVFVELSGEQARLYKQMKADFITYVNEKACVAQLAITKALRLMQIVSGFAVVEGEGNNDRSEVVIKDNPKAQALKELLSEIAPHSKCIVWLVFSQDYVTARKICSDLSLDYVEITGEVSSQNKLAAVDRFNEDPTCRVAICHPAASGVGVNMVSASYSIFYSRTFSLEYDIQAEARNYRGGSEIHEKVTRIDIIAKDTIDELVVAALAAKEDVAKKILEIAKKL